MRLLTARYPRAARRPISVSLSRAFACYGLLGLLANLRNWPGDPARIAVCACGGNKDPVQTVWFLAWAPYALLHGLDPFVTHLLDAPVGVNLAQNTSMPLLGLLGAPLTLVVNPVASENLLRWLAFPLSATAMYGVACRWVDWWPAAFVAGLFYGFSPYMVAQASVHLDLSFVPLPPLIFYAAYQVVVSPTTDPWRWGAALGVLATAQFFVSTEILATTALTCVVAALLLAVARPRLAIAQFAHATAGLATAGVIVTAACSWPVYEMTHGPLHFSGPVMGMREQYNADLLGPLLPTSAQLVAPRRLVEIGSSLVAGLANVDENGSYLGLPLLACIAWIAVRWRRDRWVLLCLAMAGASFVLSLGPRLVVDGTVRQLPFPLPFEPLERVPLLADLLPARLALYVTFFLAVVLALGIDHWHASVERRARSARAPVSGAPRLEPGARSGRTDRVALGLGAILALASILALLPRWPYRSVRATPQPAEQARSLASIRRGTTVLTYPYVTPSTDVAMLWQALDSLRFSLLGSYMVRRGPDGRATLLPSALAPHDVEAMFANPLAAVDVPIPKIPYLAPTTETVDAQIIVIGPARARFGSTRPAVSGIVQNADPHTRSFYVVGRHGELVGVDAHRSTRYFPTTRSPAPFRSVARGEHVVVFGPTGPGTLGPRRVRDLRAFLRRYDVGAVLVQLGRHDSTLVVGWLTRAIGPPARAGHGGDLWTGVQHELRRAELEGAGRKDNGQRRRPRRARRAVAMLTNQGGST
jgi:hypothetical protein